ncbi:MULTISPECIES: mannose-1-phosphate guanylyltransferase/mannose-6-phosphate isomerase [unclassified Saccharibacter]|uniref:mannose-1-phosphate guanylyltransferase/mannose-6-phosphate isomerase n=1 Tax=unclassified Saccharibacter TaxID=2648722 RepID=UPI0013225DD6|nr:MULTISPECIES: mannose-1-phosphate guanylyltransferase/mannose-6-phosphate isomerase [unclassified Saccharibacter]MXV36056.1 mannose-1-phosphate guanylyltransferase/mannose-6-phosphate isomerase [Saccharibacter sp. EH611]MXV56915.1 mannose-1-phosphate guanylyltransferase/mannose-6-phosphate isomerase [Saccharibacter sp. EH70]MXV66725.1 mannose-1-phosphate guanylyltransferase/mannose-6-phosphate isomerase [Saccharibacter sp. EH60]
MCMVVPVILSGGSGSRLWPVSRKAYPKQFCPILSEETPFQETVQRAQQIGVTAPPIVVANRDHRFIAAEQLRQLAVEDASIILEPVARNSAAAMAAAAFWQADKDPDAVLWFMPADAAIENFDALATALFQAKQAAERDYIVTFGMQPNRPETGYGYIEQGSSVENTDNVYQIARFLEKPDAETAEHFLKYGHYLWNSGMFIARARVFLEELLLLAPDIYHAVKSSLSSSGSDLGFVRLDEEAFSRAPSISVDYAVAEKTTRAAVVPASFEWMDVGSWDAVWELTHKDGDGNAAHGNVFLDHAHNCYVHSEGAVTTVTGVDDLIIVVTRDAVMVSHRDRAQDVKKMVERLKKEGRPEAEQHVRMYRPWGFYESLNKGERFQVKRIQVSPGEKLSLQKHFHRAEHWVVVEGTALVTRDDENVLVRENESIYLPLGCVHRLENPGRIPLVLIEVQSGSYLGEDDIVRLQDVYQR